MRRRAVLAHMLRFLKRKARPKGRASLKAFLLAACSVFGEHRARRAEQVQPIVDADARHVEAVLNAGRRAVEERRGGRYAEVRTVPRVNRNAAFLSVPGRFC
jgi:hypothetical protein